MNKPYYIATTKEWFDRANGNSYFSSRVENITTGEEIVIPFQYGYGNHSEHVIRKRLGLKNDWYNEDSEVHNIKFIKIDKCLKREVVAHGK